MGRPRAWAVLRLMTSSHTTAPPADRREQRHGCWAATHRYCARTTSQRSPRFSNTHRRSRWMDGLPAMSSVMVPLTWTWMGLTVLSWTFCAL